MAKQKIGRAIGSCCALCRRNTVLHVRIKSIESAYFGDNEPTRHFIDELVCPGCGLKYATLSEGTEVEDFLESQLKTIRNHTKKITRCRCGSEQFVSIFSCHSSDRFNPCGSEPEHMDERYHFSYCEDCLMVVYIIRHPKPQEKNRVFDLSPIDDCETEKP